MTTKKRPILIECYYESKVNQGIELYSMAKNRLLLRHFLLNNNSIIKNYTTKHDKLDGEQMLDMFEKLKTEISGVPEAANV